MLSHVLTTIQLLNTNYRDGLDRVDMSIAITYSLQSMSGNAHANMPDCRHGIRLGLNVCGAVYTNWEFIGGVPWDTQETN